MSNNSYVPLSRGIIPYLKSYSGNAIKLYIYLLLIAEWKGDYKGVAEFTFNEVEEKVSVTKKTAIRALHELEAGHKEKGNKAPSFIKILCMAKARGKKSKVVIRKAKLTAPDFTGKRRKKRKAKSENQETEKPDLEKAAEGRELLEQLSGIISEGKNVREMYGGGK